jgi:SAM-dependent methyltransferase
VTALETPAAAQSPFDAMAAGYDATFTRSLIGTRMRAAVQRRMDARFSPGDRILEISCGTGEDAAYLAGRGLTVLATDASQEMTHAARAKACARGLSSRIEVRTAAIETLDAAELTGDGGLFDGALSNFGGLNCVDDRRAVAARLGQCVRPGGFALLCVMGPLCPWEWAWYLLRGNPRKAFRRLRLGGSPWRGLTIQYPSIHRLRAEFEPRFHCRRVSAIGALLPPTFAEATARRYPGWVARLDAWERRIEAWPPIAHLADHYLIELERVDGGGYE